MIDAGEGMQEEEQEKSEEISGHLELVVDGFSFPTSLTFDESGTLYIAEAGLSFGGAQPGGRVWKIGQDGQRTLLVLLC
jgi:hypothetical protein